MSMSQFMRFLANDSALRDAYVAHLDDLIAAENSLDRVDTGHSVEMQRGRVIELRSLRNEAMSIDAHRGAPEGDFS